MATRAERFHAQEQRHRSAPAKKRAAEHAAKKARVKRKLHVHENVHAANKATVALEARPASGKRPSRKSSRKSANRSKFDTSYERLSEAKQATPEARYRTGK